MYLQRTCMGIHIVFQTLDFNYVLNSILKSLKGYISVHYVTMINLHYWLAENVNHDRFLAFTDYSYTTGFSVYLGGVSTTFAPST